MEFGKIGNNHSGYIGENPTIDTSTAGKLSGNSLSELMPGKVFAGEIVSVGKEKVFLRLENGQVIQAGVNGNIQLTEGQMLAFLVKSNTGKKLAIKPMFDVAIQNSSVLKALENAGMPVNSKNAELVNLLMKEQMPIDKETITKFLRQIALNPQTDMKTLVQLHKMGLPPTQENIARYESYQNHEYRLANEISNVAADISKLVGQNLTEQKNPMDVFGKIADIILETETDSGKNVEESFLAQTGKVVQEGKNITFCETETVQSGKVNNDPMPYNSAQNLTEVQKQALEHIETIVERFQGQESELNHIVESLKSLNEEAEGVIRALEKSVQNASPEAQSPQKQDMISKLYAAFEMYEAAEKSMQTGKTVAKSGKTEVFTENRLPGKDVEYEKAGQLENVRQLDEKGRFELAQKIQRASGDIHLAIQVKNGEIKPKELMRVVREMMQEIQQPGSEENTALYQKKETAVKELLQSREFQTMLKSAIEEQLLLEPEQLNKENVKEYYERLSQKMNQYTEMINQLGKEEASAMKNTTAIRQNVEYMNQLNQLYSYVQLPMKMATQNTHSELYVLTKKKRLRENGGAFTALLHLDMEVLGSMDVYITMEQKKVSARFYLQREDIAKFMESHSESLIKQLEEKGFLVKAGFEKKPEEKDLIEEFTGAQSEEHIMNKYSFDIRM